MDRIEQGAMNLKRYAQWKMKKLGIVEKQKPRFKLEVDDWALILAAIAIVILW